MENFDLTQGSQNQVGAFTARSYSIPPGYDDNKVVLMVRDPWTIFSYWEVKKEYEEKIKREIHSKGFEIQKSILRVYDVTDGESDLDSKVAFCFDLRDWADRWYIHCGSDGRRWLVDVGIMCTNGAFFCLVRSNVVETPRHAMSDVFDYDWMCPEELYYKMFAVTGGFDVGKSSMEMKEMIERHLKSWVTSGGVGSWMFGGASSFMMSSSRKK